MSDLDSDHYIGRVVIDYHVESEGDADRYYHDISRVFHSDLQKILQRVLEELDEPMMRIQIESIEIDIGEFSSGNLNEVFTTRVRDQFRKALIDKIGYPGGIKLPRSDTRFSDIVPGRLELVEEFLRTGRVPARAVHMQARAEDILQELLREYTDDTVSLIRRLAQTTGMTTRRMATQLRPSTIEMLYRALQPSYRNFLLDQELRVAVSVAKAMRISPEAARQEVRLAMLNTLLLSNRTFTPAAFRQELGDQLVRTYGTKVERLFRDNADTEQASERFSEISPASEQRALATVLEFIRTGMPSSGISVFVEAWDYLVLNAPTALAANLGKTSGQVETIIRLMNVLPDSSFEQLIERLLPTQHHKIFEVAAAVTALIVTYGSPSIRVGKLSKSILSVLVLYSIQEASTPERVSSEAAVQAIAKHFAPSKQVPNIVKEALKRQDIPGVSGLKATSSAAKPATTWDITGTESQPTPVDAPQWQGGDTPDQAGERERLLSSDREFQMEQEQAAEARLAAAKAEAERIEQAFEQEINAAAEEQGISPDTLVPDAEAGEGTPKAELPPELKALLESRAQRTAEIQARIKEEQARIEEASREAASRQRDTSSDTPYRAEEGVDPLGTIVARLDYIEHFLLTGKRPWWLDSAPASNLEMAVSSLVKVAGKRLEERLRAIILTARPQQYGEIVDRLLGSLSETHVQNILQLLLPGLAGIMPAVVRLLKRFHQNPPRAVNYPPILADQHRFAWHYLVRFSFEYLSSGTGASAMVRYAVDKTANALGEPGLIFLKDFRAIADEMIAKGEQQLSMIKNMLPMEGMPLSYDQPTAHPQPETGSATVSEEALAYIAAMRAGAEAELDSDPGSIQERFERRERSLRAHMEAAQERARQQAEAKTQPPKYIYVEGTVIGEHLSLEAAEKALERADKRLRDAEKAMAEAIERGDPAPAQARLIAAIEEQRAAAEQLEEVKLAIQQAKERREAKTVEPADTPGVSPTVTPEDASAEPPVSPETVATTEQGSPAEKPAPGDKTKEEDKQEEKPEQKPATEYTYDPDDYITEVDEVPAEKQPAAERPQPAAQTPPDAEAELTAEEVEVLREAAAQRLNLPDGAAKALVLYFETGEALVDLFRHYFQHGSLPGNLPIALPRGQFVLLFDYVMEKYPEAFFAMVRRAASNRSSRKRLLDIGETALRTAIHALSPRIAAMLLSYMESVQKLADSLSAPINKENLLEHALAYAARVQSSMFSPLDYMRNLTLYAEAELRVEPRRLIGWFKSKVEESQSGQNLAIKQVLNVLQNTLLPAEKKKDSKERVLRPLNEEIYVTNAGMCLLTPFFPQLFNLTKLLLPDRSNFLDNTARNRAIHLLQYIVTKEMDAPEEKLTLNKLFVGMPLDEPVVASVELTEEEIEIVNSMLGAAAKRWTAIKNENPEFLRAQFLDREGKIKRRGEGWDVFVSQKPYDVLLGKLPWSINPVKLPWVEPKIEIFWR